MMVALSRHPLYHSWRCKIHSCYNPKYRFYHKYGGRGVGIYEDWRHGLAGFKNYIDYIDTHLGPPPTPQHTIDRINNDGNYEPGNLRWASKREQVLNRRPLPNKVGLRGVHRNKNKFVALIQEPLGRLKYLGTFATAEEASAVYEAARALRG